MPDSLWPENRACGLGFSNELTQTEPACSLRAILSAWSTSLPQTQAPRPVFVLLARLMTSSSSDQGWVGTIGPRERCQRTILTDLDRRGDSPNGSSSMMRESLGGLSIMVGVTKKPLPSTTSVDPAAIL